jgi:cytoskeletal protein RodZ
VSQPPGGYNQDQSPWANYPPPGYPPTGQRGFPSSGYGPPQMPLPRRARRKRPRKRTVILLSVAAFLLIGIIGNAVGSGKKTSTAANVSTASATASQAIKARPSPAARPKSSAAPKSTVSREAACYKRGFASGDIYVRMLSSGSQWTAQELGGEWSWNFHLDKCLTSVQSIMATAPRNAGSCTQVGYAADNPGYDPNAAVAAPLIQVAKQAGPACQAATPSSPVQTTPAAAPASTAPVGCNPLSDEGTCYKPGEYCRDSDHGVSGVAGDGEAIACEDNDGWRWEPA